MHYISSLHVNSTDQYFLTTGCHHNVNVLDVETKKIIKLYMNIHEGTVNVGRFSNTNPYLFVTSSFDQTLAVWDMREPGTNAVQSVRGDAMFLTVSFSTDDYWYFGCGTDYYGLIVDARYSAKERYYQYRICTEPVVLGREYLWECGYKLNAELIAKEAQSFLGIHDFAPFCVPRNDGKSTICEIFEFRFEDNIFHIRGNRFLHKQVRAMVGLLVDVGRGRYALGTVERIFNGEFKGERTWAPPQGLVLAGVGY